MEYKRFNDTLLVRIDRGEEIMTELKKIALAEDVRLANISALGAVGDFTVGVFRTAEQRLDPEKPHVMLVNPSNMGNVGTILRTCLAFGIHDVAVVAPGVDWFNPKVVRASMGALFSLRIAMYDSFEEYVSFASGVGREYFPFMLNGGAEVTPASCHKPDLYTLIFGNEATGLPAEYAEIGTVIKIPQSGEVDSLNLTIAVGIGLYSFSERR